MRIVSPFAALAASLALLLAGCRDDPDDAPPVGTATTQSTTSAITVPVAPVAAAVVVDPAIRHADFRLAVLDARERLDVDLNACAPADADCHDRALADYDLATAAASREFAIDAAQVIDLQRPAPRDPGSEPLVQLGGSRG